jgi:hypothetical protein
MDMQALGRWLPLLVLGQPAWAGPWCRPAGSVYAKLGAGHFQGQAAFEDSTLPFRGEALEGYAEVGLGHDLELDSSLALVSSRVGEASSLGLQDLDVTLDWAPVSAREAFALTLGTRVSLYRRGLQPELGPGGADLLLGAGWGRSLGPGWLAVDLSWRHRLVIPSSGLRLRAELGLQGQSPVGGALTLEAQPASGRSPLQPAAPAPAPIPRALSLGLKAFARLGAGFGLAADTAWLPAAVNDGPGWRIGGGLSWEG